jgi:GTPase SAR1 family protein
MKELPLPHNYQSYRQTLFWLVAVLQKIETLARRWGLHEQATQAQVAREHMEEQRFTVAMLGEFKRGKSTLINALLGANVLPADVTPTTATINRVTYGLSPSATLLFHHPNTPPRVVDIKDLGTLISKNADDHGKFAKEIREVVVQWPVRLCKNDVDLLDTPGLGDEQVMSDITLKLLPRVDVAFFVTMATSPFSQTEAAFLRTILTHKPSGLFFVLTAMDSLKKEADRARIQAFVQQRVEEELLRYAEEVLQGREERQAFLEDNLPVRLFCLSGQQALDAKVQDQPQLLAQSQLPPLEEALESFLTHSDTHKLRRHLKLTQELHASLEAEAQTRLTALPASEHKLHRERERLYAMLEAMRHALQQGLRDWREHTQNLVQTIEQELNDLIHRCTEQIQTYLQGMRKAAQDAHKRGQYAAWAEHCAHELQGKLQHEAKHTTSSLAQALLFQSINQEQVLVHQAKAMRKQLLAVEHLLQHIEQRQKKMRWEEPTGPESPPLDYVQRLRAWLDSDLETLLNKAESHHKAQILIPSAQAFHVALLDDHVLAMLPTPSADIFSQVSNLLNPINSGTKWTEVSFRALGIAFRHQSSLHPPQEHLQSWIRSCAHDIEGPLVDALERIQTQQVNLHSHTQKISIRNEHTRQDLQHNLTEIQQSHKKLKSMIFS